jgi:5-formyltetrahydrofolate cyclo-ligase
METAAQEKVALRKQMRAQLDGQSAADVRAKSAAIWERLSVMPEFASARRLLLYISTMKEVGTHGLIRQLLAMGCELFVPCFETATQRYVASGLHDFDADLAIGKFGILEPIPEAVRPVTFEEIDAVLVPGLAFDEIGNRLGRGLGYFDRLLRQINGVKIAPAFDFQVVDEVLAEAHDLRMDFIVTEIRVIKTKGNRQ